MRSTWTSADLVAAVVVALLAAALVAGLDVALFGVHPPHGAHASSECHEPFP